VATKLRIKRFGHLNLSHGFYLFFGF